MTDKKKCTFKLPIGDWSGDGHGKCDYYLIESNKSVQQVREVHFKIFEKTGINIHAIANDYEDSHISYEVFDALTSLGYNFIENHDDDDEGFYATSKEMANIWIFLLTKTDKKLMLKIIDDKDDMLPFYGYDKKKRHIDGVGYGCFSE